MKMILYNNKGNLTQVNMKKIKYFVGILKLKEKSGLIYISYHSFIGTLIWEKHKPIYCKRECCPMNRV